MDGLMDEKKTCGIYLYGPRLISNPDNDGCLGESRVDERKKRIKA